MELISRCWRFAGYADQSLNSSRINSSSRYGLSDTNALRLVDSVGCKPGEKDINPKYPFAIALFNLPDLAMWLFFFSENQLTSVNYPECLSLISTHFLKILANIEQIFSSYREISHNYCKFNAKFNSANFGVGAVQKRKNLHIDKIPTYSM